MPGSVAGEFRAAAFEDLAEEREADRLRRIMARFVGLAYAAYLAVAMARWTVLNDLPVAVWYVPVALLLTVGPGLALLPASYVSRRGVIEACIMLAPAGLLIALQLWPIAWTGVPFDRSAVAWLTPFVGLPAIAVVLARSLWLAFTVLIVCAFGWGAILALGNGGLNSETLARLVWMVAFTGVFVVAIGQLVSSGQLLQESRAEAVAAAVESSATAAWQVERDRFSALIHDHVIATLVAAAESPDEERLPGQARATLAALDRAAVTSSTVQPPLSAGAVIATLRSAIGAVDELVDVKVGYLPEEAGPPGGGFPRQPVDAVVEAVTEAVRNSVSHAGPAASRAVLIQLGDGLLLVTVVDDGVGFNPGAVPLERLGIEVSIHRRMSVVPGGRARLRSAVGDGTTVQIGWHAQ